MFSGKCVSGVFRRAFCLVALLAASSAFAQERGFAVHRYDSTTAGSWLFMVERPWYSGTRYFAVGITIDGALNPLVSALSTGRGAALPIISAALLGHIDLAGSLFDRVLIRASMPVTLVERGNAEAVSQSGPLSSIAVGDPRVGLMVRLFGQTERDPFSLHIGGDVWIPLYGPSQNEGDLTLRFMPRLVMAGAAGKARWTVDAGFLIRSYSSIGPPQLGMTAASEGRVGFGFGFALLDERLYLGPEVKFSSQVFGANAFKPNGMSLEVMGGAQVLIAEHLQLGIAAGAGFLGAAGTPDARALVRIAWAPRHLNSELIEAVAVVDAGVTDDADFDGVTDVADRCPFEPETKNGVRDFDGCPEYAMPKGSPLARVLTAMPLEKSTPRDAGMISPADAGVINRTNDAVAKDARVAANKSVADAGSDARVEVLNDVGVGRDAGDARVAVINNVEAARDAGSVASDARVAVISSSARDAGVFLDATAATLIDASKLDSDGDYVPDELDSCPVQPEDYDDFEDEDGCPELDNDFDGILDVADRCPLEAETPNGVDDQDGCPDAAPDADQDWLADSADRCPYEPETYDGIRDDDGCPEYQGPSREELSRLIAPPPVIVPDVTEVTPELVEAALDSGRGDADHDGVIDEADRCPVTPEDLDGFEDEDGCPELDNDGDEIADTSDKCPAEAEAFNGWQDGDGCPDLQQDLDADGVGYDADRCPYEFGDSSDGCPHEALPKLALVGFPGEPAPQPEVAAPAETPVASADPVVADFDADAASDEADRCPISAEDADGFEDEDGCPELDNDSDGIPDSKDKCPFEAETINGVKDDDGCPDKGASKVSIEGEHIVIKGIILFTSGSAKLTPSSMPLLKQVASTLKAAKSISVEIQGHTDDVGNATKNIKLSKQRADAIRKVLIKEGVAENRLLTNGYGPTRPVATNKTAKGREKNRRVEFLILGESK
jgi:outer membrane protein OmpA-like peptidoglycan-associated protein